MKKALLASVLLAGCAQLPQTPEDIRAKRFEAVPDKAVIYVVRAPLDSFEVSGLSLGDGTQIATHRGTYYRWEVAPGTHRIAGVGSAMETFTLNAAAGRIYFVQHTVIGDPTDGGVQVTALSPLGEQTGRNLVLGAELLR